MLEQADQFVKQIVDGCCEKQIWVAYSGGVDSHVLLHLLATAEPSLLDRNRLHAIHIDHGIQPESNQWAQHCRQIAEDLSVDYCEVKVDVTGIADHGIEAAARKARYQAISSRLPDDAVLLTAQHQQDQAETLLLQLLRGAGPKGLSAMASHSHYQSLAIMRPFLNIAKSAIMNYAHQHLLKWIEDPSNSDTQINRNYLRHSVWPEIEQRWPSATKTLGRSAEHCAQADELMTDLAMIDLAAMAVGSDASCLPIVELLTLSVARRINVLRYVIHQQGLALPSAQVLERVFAELCCAEQDRNPIVSWHGGEIRRFQGQLYCLQPLLRHDDQQVIICESPRDTTLSNGQLLHWQANAEYGVPKQFFSANLTLRFRQGGERIRLQGHQYHQSLKHLFQQWAIPPWQRNRIPLIYLDDELIAVAGYGLSDSLQSAKQQQGYLPIIK